MPQFQAANFVPQLAWLTIFFVILYFGIVRATLPRIGRVVDGREAQVKGDLDRAESAKGEADHVREAYEASMARARSEAQASVAHAGAEAARTTEARLREADAVTRGRVEEAEAALARSRSAVSTEMERVAADAAAEIVVLLGGARPDGEAALAAVRQVG